MANKVQVNILTLKAEMTRNEGVAITMSGLRTLMERADFRDDYTEGQYGDQIIIPVSLLLSTFKDVSVEVVSE